jgi:hypothetical protein
VLVVMDSRATRLLTASPGAGDQGRQSDLHFLPTYAEPGERGELLALGDQALQCLVDKLTERETDLSGAKWIEILVFRVSEDVLFLLVPKDRRADLETDTDETAIDEREAQLDTTPAYVTRISVR